MFVNPPLISLSFGRDKTYMVICPICHECFGVVEEVFIGGDGRQIEFDAPIKVSCPHCKHFGVIRLYEDPIGLLPGSLHRSRSKE